METEAVLGTDLSDKIGEEDKDSRNADQDHKTKQRRILSIDSFYAHGDIQLLEHKQALVCPVDSLLTLSVKCVYLFHIVFRMRIQSEKI